MIGLPGKARPSTNAEQKKQEAALAKLMKEREAYARSHMGMWPSDEEIYMSRKKKKSK